MENTFLAPREPEEANHHADDGFKIETIHFQLTSATVEYTGIVDIVHCTDGIASGAASHCKFVDEPKRYSGWPVSTEIRDCIQESHVGATNVWITNLGMKCHNRDKHAVDCNLM